MGERTKYMAIAKDSGCHHGCCKGFNKTRYFVWLRDAVQWLRQERKLANGTFSYKVRECGPEIDLYLDDKDYD